MKTIFAVLAVISMFCGPVQATENWWTGTLHVTWNYPDGTWTTNQDSKEFRYLDACTAWVERSMDRNGCVFCPEHVSGSCVKDVNTRQFLIITPQ